MVLWLPGERCKQRISQKGKPNLAMLINLILEVGYKSEAKIKRVPCTIEQNCWVVFHALFLVTIYISSLWRPKTFCFQYYRYQYLLPRQYEEV